MKTLINYYIIDRRNGISYEPCVCGETFILAYPNRATGTEVLINTRKLVKGLTEKRYRLIPKN